MSTKTRILVPVKNLENAKTSFSEVLDDEERRELTLFMLEDVLETASRVKGAELAVVTPDEDVIDFVESNEIKTIFDSGSGLNAALEGAIEGTVELGFQEVLIIPADVPLMRTTDIENILGMVSGDQGVVIAPSKEEGTNALLMRPSDVIDIHFGGKSFPEHVRECMERGIEFQVYESERLSRDIDNPKDFLKVETLGAGTKTHSFLISLK